MDVLTRQQTILIVDDAKANINILTELLRADFKIRAATNGEKAFEIAQSDNPPDLILLDVQMPGMDGYTVCRKLKETSRTWNIPVIFITGNGSVDDEIYGFTIGAVDYITKPFSDVVVRARINTHAELKRHRDYLEEISYLDGLTGIPNRRKFNEYTGYTCSFAAADSAPVSVIMIDIDYFKLFNDRYGHQAGDSCLSMIAQSISREITRKADLAARYGGEEFAVILPDMPEKTAVAFAEKLRQNVESLNIPHEWSKVSDRVTISLGVASHIPNPSFSCHDLIRKADEALYRSKQSGRNRVGL